jgi:hypothetical protein
MEPEDGILALDALREHYEGEWVAGVVVERGPDQTPTRMRVLAHSASFEDVLRRTSSESDVCVLYAGDLVPEGREFIV